MVADEVRAGRMTEEQAETHPSRNIISRALGAEATVDVDLKTMMVEPGTAFLICSDGVTRHVADQEIKGVLTFGGEPVEICEYIKGLCYERGAEDNLTAVIVKVSAREGEIEGTTIGFVSDAEEPTIATARSPFESKPEDDENELLELETKDLSMPEGPEKSPPEPVEVKGVSETTDLNTAETIQTDAFSMFGNSGAAEEEEDRPSSLGKIASAIGLLLLGSIIGLGVYHFALAPKPADTGGPQLSEMRAANIPLSAFEENRRDVDKDPAGYITKFALSPQDCEDYYLLGRAYMLTGDFIKARAAFNESRNRLADADPVNAKILASDIAMALAVTNDTTIQKILKTELDAASKPSANTNTNANR